MNFIPPLYLFWTYLLQSAQRLAPSRVFEDAKEPRGAKGRCRWVADVAQIEIQEAVLGLYRDSPLADSNG
jgi:hypothetical protein